MVETGILLAALTAAFAGEGMRQDSSAALLRRAVENQYHGAFSAQVVFVRESFLRGSDSLRGRMVFDDATGERRLDLRGRDEAFEWWSLNFGQEQWWKDDKTSRVRRIPYRSMKKPAFASLLSYEDLLKFPSDYLLDYQSCLISSETDSSYELTLSIRPDTRSRYGALEISLGKRPVLLKRAVFFAWDGRKLKSLEISSYARAGEKYFPLGLRVFDGDTLATLRLALSHPQAAAAFVGQDKTAVPRGGMPAYPERVPEIALEPMEDEGGAEEDAADRDDESGQ